MTQLDPSWMDGFLEALPGTADRHGRVSVVKAAQFVGVSRTLAYRRRVDTPAFRRKWDEIVLLCLENARQAKIRKVRNRLASMV